MSNASPVSQSSSQSHSSFISPFWDFIFVGGLTFVVWPFVTLIQHDLKMLLALSLAMYGATYFLNGPHFLYSYQILYADFWKKLSSAGDKASRVRYFLSGVIVPILLMGLFAYAYIDGVRVGQPDFLGSIVNLMLFLVGWHYTKQGYGSLITLSVKKRVFYSEIEKRILLYNGYIVWFTAWVFSNGKMARAADTYFGIPFKQVYLTEEFFWLPYVTLLSSVAAVLIFILRAHRHSVSWNGWTGYFSALYVWTGMLALQPVLILVIPALHSLQYMLFVGKLSFGKGRERESQGGSSGVLGFMALGVVLAALCFWALPTGLDHWVGYDQDIFGPTFFFIIFLVFINIHHYFIDFAIWRKDNPDMKYLYH